VVSLLGLWRPREARKNSTFTSTSTSCSVWYPVPCGGASRRDRAFASLRTDVWRVVPEGEFAQAAVTEELVRFGLGTTLETAR
jgi:hypothetical protein